MTIEQLAAICHNMNRNYSYYCLGDKTHKSWEASKPWQRESAIDGVRFALEEARTPEQSHENWMRHKLESGWKYGPVKDQYAKEHPCLVPYEQLPHEQRLKDKLFVMIVNLLKNELTE